MEGVVDCVPERIDLQGVEEEHDGEYDPYDPLKAFERHGINSTDERMVSTDFSGKCGFGGPGVGSGGELDRGSGLCPCCLCMFWIIFR